MRDDIAKKILEPPRYGGGGKNQFKKHERRAGKDPRKWDTLPKKESMKRPNIRGWNGKYFNATTTPLDGFLRKSVGRPWDKVYSEICSALRPTSATLKRVFSYLIPNMVELHPYFKEGSNIPYNPGWGPRYARSEVWGFYVDRHGLLKDNGSPKAKLRQARNYIKRSRDASRRRINDFEEYRKLNGSWFHVWYKNVREGESGYDVILRKEIMVGRWGSPELERSNGVATHMGKRLGWGRYRVAVEKRQISKKEIKREGLNKTR